jgi:hypothetical protein
MTKARNLRVGDSFSIVSGQIVAITAIAGGKRFKIKLLLQDQTALEFLDDGCTLEFLCRPGKQFNAWPWRSDGDDGDGEPEPATDPDPTGPVLVDVDDGRG